MESEKLGKRRKTTPIGDVNVVTYAPTSVTASQNAKDVQSDARQIPATFLSSTTPSAFPTLLECPS
jgi:hypothetical protein